MKKGSYRVISSTIVYKNPWIEVREDKIKTDKGKDGVFGTVDYGRGITICAVNSKREVYLIKEYYYVLEEYGVQLPSGGIDNGETPLEAAKRELKEETGIIAKQWYELGFIQHLTMIVKTPTYLLLTVETEEREQTNNTTARIIVPFDTAYNRVLNNEIVHAASCMTLVKAKHFMQEHQLL